MKNKKIDLLFIAEILLMLVILSVNSMSNLYARYITGDSSTDSARVAKFDVSDSFFAEQDLPLSIKPGETKELIIEVNNNSEVAVLVTVDIINVTGNLPLIFSSTTKEIAPKTTDTVTFTVSWNSGESSPEFAEMVDVIKLSLTAKQID